MVILPGELSIKTIHGRNGPFNVGRLVVSLGLFTVKDAELDQFKEGKYEGDFVIKSIRQHPVPTEAGVFMQLRAYLSGMTLHDIDTLTESEASTIGAQEPDPVDEDVQLAKALPPPASSPEPSSEPSPKSNEESASGEGAINGISQTDLPKSDLGDTTPIQASTTATTTNEVTTSGDEALFGTLWPLPDVFKLDKTVGRMKLRQQTARLHELGYEIDFSTQDWFIPALAE